MRAREEQPVVDPEACWCGRTAWELLFRTRKAGLARCMECGTYRTDPRPLRQDEESSEFYSRYYEDKVGDIRDVTRSHKARTSRFWKVVKQYPPLSATGVRALDVGCGDGTLCNELRRHGWRDVVGIDVSRSRIASARLRYPDVRFSDTPIEEMRLAKNSQELIIMDNVIEHLPEPLRFVRTVRPLLRADGMLAILTPNMESGQFLLLGKRWTPELAPHTHIFLFTAKTLVELVEAAGYRVVAYGSFHVTVPAFKKFWQSVVKGPKELLFWMTMQAAALYARLIRSGEQIFVVAQPADESGG